MKRINIKLNNELYEEFSIVCTKIKTNKHNMITSLIGEFLEDRELAKIVNKRMRELKQRGS